MFRRFLLGMLCCLGSDMLRAQTVTYIHVDALGSPILETNAAGANIRAADYRAYGDEILNGPQRGPAFTGHYRDIDSGLLYTEQRYFDTSSGRFLSVDPIAGGAGRDFNRYFYAFNNPYKYVDPDGRYSCTGTHLNCSQFEAGMVSTRLAAVSSRLTKDEQKSVKDVADFYGGPQDQNNVMVGFGGDAFVGGTAIYDEKTGVTHITVRPDPDVESMATHAVHEGQHGLTDHLRRRTDLTRDERMNNEIGAYTTEAYYRKAVRRAWNWEDIWTPARGVSNEQILKKAIDSVEKSCGRSSGGSC